MKDKKYKIEKGTTLYRDKFHNYEEVRVYDIYLEEYINGWYTTIKVINKNQVLYTYFAGELNKNLFIEIPKEEE